MRITFVLPELNLPGCLRVIAIYANLLSEKGHDVTVVSPNKRFLISNLSLLMIFLHTIDSKDNLS